MPDEEEIPISIKVVNVRSLLRYVDEHGVEHMPDESDFIDWDDDMDTPPTIPPALTPEEWRHARDLAAEIDTLRFQLDCVQPDDFGAMAIANSRLPDDHPRKITQADVDACLSTARHWEGVADASAEWGHRETQYEWERRAAKLAALLPPDGA